eukprot:Selendium_serpulae@DN5787_c0_g2_i12.p1
MVINNKIANSNSNCIKNICCFSPPIKQPATPPAAAKHNFAMHFDAGGGKDDRFRDFSPDYLSRSVYQKVDAALPPADFKEDLSSDKLDKRQTRDRPIIGGRPDSKPTDKLDSQTSLGTGTAGGSSGGPSSTNAWPPHASSPSVSPSSTGLHAVHLYTKQDCSDPGEHYDPTHTHTHAGPDGGGHLGDLHNLDMPADGHADYVSEVHGLTMEQVATTSIIIWELEDLYNDSQTSYGTQLGCGAVPGGAAGVAASWGVVAALILGATGLHL